MTPASLYPKIREDAGRDPLTGEPVATDEDAAASMTDTFSDEELLPLVWSAADMVAASVDARHVPARIVERSGTFSGGASLGARTLRLLPSRVYGGSGAPFDVRDRDGADQTPLTRVRNSTLRRRPLSPGAYAWDGSELQTSAGDAAAWVDVVASPSARGATDDLGLPDYLEQAVVLCVLSAVFASRGEGKAVTARNAYLRAVAPYGGRPDEMQTAR